jgi:hypothetical protein
MGEAGEIGEAGEAGKTNPQSDCPRAKFQFSGSLKLQSSALNFNLT